MTLRSNVHAIVWTYRHLTGKLPEHGLETILTYLSPGSICFDVGAHGGSWSHPLARAVSNGHVYAFEALPYYADVLRKTMRLLRQKRVTVLNKAVGESVGVVQMVRRDGEGNTLTGETHVAIDHEVAREKVAVPTITLDSFWREIGEKHVDFVKCDIEGFELFALRGARQMIERCNPLFYTELNSEWCKRYSYEPGDIFGFFDERHYTPYYITGDGKLDRVNVGLHVNRDVLFLPKRRIQT